MSSTINIHKSDKAQATQPCSLGIGLWAGGGDGGAKFLRSGKNQCEIRAKQIFVTLRKLRDVRENLCVCREVFGMSGNFFWYMSGKFCRRLCRYVRRNFFGYVRKKISVTPPRSPTILGRNINVQFACSSKLYCAPPPNKIRPIRP